MNIQQKIEDDQLAMWELVYKKILHPILVTGDDYFNNSANTMMEYMYNIREQIVEELKRYANE